MCVGAFVFFVCMMLKQIIILWFAGCVLLFACFWLFVIVCCFSFLVCLRFGLFLCLLLFGLDCCVCVLGLLLCVDCGCVVR